MQRRTRLLWWGALLGLCAGMAACLPGTAEVVGYPEGRLVLVEEPSATSDYVEFYRGGEQLTAADMMWVEGGVHGQAVRLDGRSEYLLVNYSQMQMPEMTLTAWVNWQGSPDGRDGRTVGQRLFTMYRNEQNFLTVSLRQQQPQAGTIDGQAYGYDGVYMEYRLGGEDGVRVVAADPVFHGESYALPRREWHHLAVRMNGQTLALYIDGVRWFEKELLLGVADMQATALLLGGNIWGDPLLYAHIDDVAMYNAALSAEQIGLLADGATLAFASPTSPPTAYLPTQPSAASNPATTVADTAQQELLKQYTQLVWGLPLWTVILVGVLLVLFIAATVAVNVRAARERRTLPPKGGNGDD